MQSFEYRQEADRQCKSCENVLLVFFLFFLINCALSLFGDIDSFSNLKENINSVIAGNGIIYGNGPWRAVASFAGLGGFIIAGPLELSQVKISKKIYSGINLEASDIGTGFSDFGNSFILYLLRGIFVFLWSLLLIIPGIIKSLSYSMAFFIHDDKPSLSVTDCINESMQIMDGHKLDLFCLLLSYIGWYILCALTCGILSIWVTPRVNQARYLFYLNIANVSVEKNSSENEKNEDHKIVIDFDE